MTERKMGKARQKSFWHYGIITIPLILGIGFLMGRISNSGYGNIWFDALEKPAIMPPGWAFGFAWSLLYIFLGIAIALIFRQHGAPGREKAIGLFTVQMLLNFSWTPIFFAYHRPDLALSIIVLILIISTVTTFLFARINKWAAWLMVPYLGWLCFASMLNYQIMVLNPGA